ncbi:MAG: hypothetical protein IJD97_12570 [Clostridia bacterium]|nr:hypothetical protein [Clostridia bacterium]
MKEIKITGEMIEELFSVITEVKDNEECMELFEDLCTRQEIEKMAQRIRAAKLLSEGKTYNQVIEETDISSATLSRVSKALRYGKGYKKFIK